ncbi:hypothetical protein STEG23_024566, partial [Scotinomys teguina]
MLSDTMDKGEPSETKTAGLQEKTAKYVKTEYTKTSQKPYIRTEQANELANGMNPTHKKTDLAEDDGQ